MKKSLISILVLIMVLSSVFILACKEPTEEVIPAPAPEGVEAESLGEYGKVTLSFGAFSDIHFSSVCDKQVKEYYPKALADIMKQRCCDQKVSLEKRISICHIVTELCNA